MRIGIITNLYPPYMRGGAEAVIVRTVGALLAMGHDVFVITTHPHSLGHEAVEDRSSAERIYRFFPRNLYFTLNDYKHSIPVRALWHSIDLFSPFAARRVLEICSWERPDVVITHNLKGIGLAIPRALQKAGIPQVQVVHDLQLVVPSGLLFYGKEKPIWPISWLGSLYRALCRFQVGKPNCVIFPSTYLQNVYLQYGFFKNVDVRMFPNPAPSFPVSTKPPVTEGPLKLAFAGQLAEHKGVEFLLKAFASLPFDARLYIAGDGPLRHAVERAAVRDPRITYLGFLPSEEISKVFSVADVVVVPSLCYENSPTVIYEALHAGLPVIASRIGGVGELLTEGVSGYLFTPGSREEFVTTVTRFRGEREQFAARRAEIRASVAPHELSRYAERLGGILATVVEKARTR